MLICVAILVSLVGCASYGYILNDSFDIEQDRLAGKKNRMQDVRGMTRFVLVCLALFIGFLPFLLHRFPQAALLVVLANCLLSTLYSAVPFRWKERAVLAVFLDAAAAHFLPVLLVFVMFSDFGTPFSIAASVWAFLNGLRQIILHQFYDRENDVRAGVLTFVRKTGVAKAQFILRTILIPAEIITFLVIASIISNTQWIFLIPIALYTVIYILKSLLWKRSKNIVTNYLPPNDFYDSWFPLTLATLLIFQNVEFVLLLMIHLALFYKDIKRRVAESLRLIRDVAKVSLAR
jgi:4-hydroxybenzoate polyprenyltransferase